MPDDFNEKMWPPVGRKPPLGVRPAAIAAWERIGELAAGIERQYESANGDIELVRKWCAEINAQCLMIETARRYEHGRKQETEISDR